MSGTGEGKSWSVGGELLKSPASGSRGGTRQLQNAVAMWEGIGAQRKPHA